MGPAAITHCDTDTFRNLLVCLGTFACWLSAPWSFLALTGCPQPWFWESCPSVWCLESGSKSGVSYLLACRDWRKGFLPGQDVAVLNGTGVCACTGGPISCSSMALSSPWQDLFGALGSSCLGGAAPRPSTAVEGSLRGFWVWPEPLWGVFHCEGVLHRICHPASPPRAWRGLDLGVPEEDPGPRGGGPLH